MCMCDVVCKWGGVWCVYGMMCGVCVRYDVWCGVCGIGVE